MHLSHKTQEMLNYFDETDSRVREVPYTLDAQLLNLAAVQLEDAEQRIGREISSRTLATCPVHLDNHGVYYATRLSNNIMISPDQTSLTAVQGVRAGVAVELTPFDDRLPVPFSYELDPDRAIMALADPVLFDLNGLGDPVDKVWNVQTVGPYLLDLPNRLTFYVEGSGSERLLLNILVEGITHPKPLWLRQQNVGSETLLRLNEGAFVSMHAWSSISRIVVRGLPLGARLRCWQIPFNLPAVPDAARPYAHTAYRDSKFDRYWSLSPSENLLKEMFMLDNLSTLETVQTYSLPYAINCVAVEPRTSGLLVGSGSILRYTDRREPLPDNLKVTALTQEPLFGLDCSYDFTKPGSVRYLYIRPVSYGAAATMTQWRYIIEDPAGVMYALLPDGSQVDYSGGAGWQIGRPAALSIPLVYNGTYVVTMECMDLNNVISFDSFPYPNLALGGQDYDLAALVPEILGIAYDCRENLWLWTGDLAVPVRPVYHGYLLDAASRTLFMTERFEQIQYE